MKSIYITILDSLVQFSISDALYASVTDGLREEDTALHSIKPLLVKACTYTLALLDFEETGSGQSKAILNGIHDEDLVLGIASLWRHNAAQHSDGDALVVVPFDEHYKRLIREAGGLVQYFALDRFNGAAKAHNVVSFEVPTTAFH